MFPIDIKEFPPLSEFPIITPIHNPDSKNKNIPDFPCHIIPLLKNGNIAIPNWETSRDHSIEPKERVAIKCGEESGIFALTIWPKQDNELSGEEFIEMYNINTLIIEDKSENTKTLLFKYEPIFNFINNKMHNISIRFNSTGSYVHYNKKHILKEFNNNPITNFEPQPIDRIFLKAIISNINKPIIANMDSLVSIFGSLKDERYNTREFVEIMKNISEVICKTDNEKRNYYNLCEKLSKLTPREVNNIWKYKNPENKNSFMKLNEWLKEDLPSSYYNKISSRVGILPGFSRGLLELDDLDFNIHEELIYNFLLNHVFIVLTSTNKKIYLTKDYIPNQNLMRFNFLTEDQLMGLLRSIKIRNAICNSKMTIEELVRLIDETKKANDKSVSELIDIGKLENKLLRKDGNLADLLYDYSRKNTYLDITFIPYSKYYQPNFMNEKSLNLFTGFAYDSTIELNDESERLLDPLMNSIRGLCSDDNIFNSLLNYFACILQSPQKRNKVVIVINSSNINIINFFEWFGRSLGDSYYCKTSNSTEFQYKLLVLFDDNKNINQLNELMLYDELIDKYSNNKITNYCNCIAINPNLNNIYPDIPKIFLQPNNNFICLETYNNLFNHLCALLLKRDLDNPTNIPEIDNNFEAKLRSTPLIIQYLYYYYSKNNTNLKFSVGELLVELQKFVKLKGYPEVINTSQKIAKLVSIPLGITAKEERIKGHRGERAKFYNITKLELEKFLSQYQLL